MGESGCGPPYVKSERRNISSAARPVVAVREQHVGRAPLRELAVPSAAGDAEEPLEWREDGGARAGDVGRPPLRAVVDALVA